MVRAAIGMKNWEENVEFHRVLADSHRSKPSEKILVLAVMNPTPLLNTFVLQVYQ